ncbi:uncharacterized protein FOMMEDRAFT_111395 [Fomitiporia mediterranea MF3/22]|uniref:uncharacterized protein n=1 Tax=Fomitiporia mediterranea (strain MF3/22) TaxID=694068 RepID=UPI0004407DC3|nr:uncharacterized protein FOMMEDRAFT_111395 [Fomitiporia mediterranea MF3/22]EJD01515.1 hypothetical protein FOMMEDRAFT_111395 [Fomitiporia mediterranea MF3/22]
MARNIKGKKRELSTPDPPPSRASTSSLSPPPEEQAKPKRAKRAEVRTCPVCDEKIPIRLLGAHAKLEMNRVEEILRGAGPSVITLDPASGLTAGRRGAAMKARRTINPHGDPEMSTIEQIEKTLKLLHRNRKSRNVRLKEIIAQDEDERPRAKSGLSNELVCPVCLMLVRGDQDVIDAHVDSCVANASRLQAEAEERERLDRERTVQTDPWSEIEIDGQIRVHLNDVRGLRGMGVHVRDSTQLDVDEEVDVDGDDEFGVAQFTEQDVVDPNSSQDIDVGGDDDDEGGTLRDLVAEGKVTTRKLVTPNLDGVRAEVEQVIGVGETDQMDQAVEVARKSGDTAALIAALENKVKQLETMRVSSSTSLLCRICLDPYYEPTVSTGCWHTCCRGCWLRCLGSTRLCPICKRITAATDLRRVYL